MVDQRMASYTCKAKSKRWTLPAFSYILDVTRINASSIFWLISCTFAGWGGFAGLRDGRFAGCGIIQLRDFRNAELNPALFQCGIVVLLIPTLANCLKLDPA